MSGVGSRPVSGCEAEISDSCHFAKKELSRTTLRDPSLTRNDVFTAAILTGPWTVFLAAETGRNDALADVLLFVIYLLAYWGFWLLLLWTVRLTFPARLRIDRDPGPVGTRQICFGGLLSVCLVLLLRFDVQTHGFSVWSGLAGLAAVAACLSMAGWPGFIATRPPPALWATAGVTSILLAAAAFGTMRFIVSHARSNPAPRVPAIE